MIQPWRTLSLIAILSAAPALATAGADESLEGTYLSNVRQVTSRFLRAGEGYFSPDGKTIVFQAVPPGYPFYQIYVQSLENGLPRRISTGRGRTTCSYFAPAGDRVIFASSHLDPQLSETEDGAFLRAEADHKSGRRRRYQWDFDPHMEIFSARPDGSDLKRLTRAKGYDAECAFSPDGSRIVFCSDRDGDADLYIMNADGSDVRQLTDASGYDGGPFFSPDGEWVVYRSDRLREGFLQIHAIRTDGTCDIALTSGESVNWAPYWHPERPYVIWAGADHSDPKARPNYDLWMMKFSKENGRIAAGPVSRVTDHAAADVLPVFSPDGNRLMWTSTRTADRTSQLWIADLRIPE